MARCPFPGCECLHVGCVAGWLDLVDEHGRDRTAPCPTCRPEVAQHLRYAPGTLADARRGLRRLDRPSRTPASK
jgi:hypothetical protein